MRPIDLPTAPAKNNLSEVISFDSLAIDSPQPVSALILGHNLESIPQSIQSLRTERLENPKFVGPANPQTGLAPGWQPRGNQMGRLTCELTAGMSFSGHESQYLHAFCSSGSTGILQTGRRLFAGEALTVSLWAKARRQPARLSLQITPLAIGQPVYDAAEVIVDTPHWQRYDAQLTAPCDDDQAVFAIMIQGEGLLWIDQIHLYPTGAPDLRPDLTERLAHFGPTALRFPGGCLASNYRWRYGLGPVEERPAVYDPVFKQNGASYDFGTDEYLQLCADHQITPHLTVNVGSGTPAEAADWAAHCAAFFRKRSKTLPTCYFQIGNEHYGTGESAFMTPAMYVAALQRYAPGIRAAYPGCRLIALGEPLSRGFHEAEVQPWQERVIREAAEHFDLLAINRYKGQWFDQPEARMHNAIESSFKIQRDLQHMAETMAQHGLAQRVALTEWNYRLTYAHYAGPDTDEPEDAPHAFFVAAMLHALAALGPSAELANYYHLHWKTFGTLLAKRADSPLHHSIAEIFRFYRPALPGTLTHLRPLMAPPTGDLAQEAPLGPGSMTLAQPGQRWTFLIHPDPAEPLTLTAAELPAGISEIQMLQAETIDSPLTLHTLSLSRSQTLNVPPLAIVRLQHTDH